MAENKYLIEYTHCIIDPDHIYSNMSDIIIKATNKLEAAKLFYEINCNDNFNVYKIEKITEVN